MIARAQAPNFAVVIHLAAGAVDYQVMGRAGVEEVLKSLDLVRDDLLIKASREAEEPTDIPDMPPPEESEAPAETPQGE